MNHRQLQAAILRLEAKVEGANQILQNGSNQAAHAKEHARMLKAKLSNRLAQIQERRDVTRMMQIRQKLGATKFVQEGRVATPLGSLKLR